jgi:hypothetical protein
MNAKKILDVENNFRLRVGFLGCRKFMRIFCASKLNNKQANL